MKEEEVIVAEKMTPLDELSHLLFEKRRIILVAEGSVDLSSLQGKNSIYILQLPESSTAAGGRVGGFGERKIQKVYCFRYENGACEKVLETDDPERLERFELPYHAAGLPIVLRDGTEMIVSGVVDPEFISSYKQVT